MFKWLEKNLPKIVIAPSIGLISWFVYGFILWTLYISFTKSKILPKYELWGVGQYVKLWGLRKWHIAVENLLIFTILFFIIISCGSYPQKKEVIVNKTVKVFSEKFHPDSQPYLFIN